MVVYECLFLRFRGGPQGCKFFRSVESIVGVSALDELFGVFAVNILSLGLPVRGMRMPFGCGFHYFPVFIDTFVRDDAAPAQGFYDIFFRAFDEPLRVRVFYADDEVASSLFCVEIIVKRGTYSAHVKRPCRRRGEPDSCLFFHS